MPTLSLDLQRQPQCRRCRFALMRAAHRQTAAGHISVTGPRQGSLGFKGVCKGCLGRVPCSSSSHLPAVSTRTLIQNFKPIRLTTGTRTHHSFYYRIRIQKSCASGLLLQSLPLIPSLPKIFQNLLASSPLLTGLVSHSNITGLYRPFFISFIQHCDKQPGLTLQKDPSSPPHHSATGNSLTRRTSRFEMLLRRKINADISLLAFLLVTSVP